MNLEYVLNLSNVVMILASDICKRYLSYDSCKNSLENFCRRFYLSRNENFKKKIENFETTWTLMLT